MQTCSSGLSVLTHCFSLQQYPNFGDLIKVSMNRSRENTPILWYKTVFTCLKNCFLAYKDENGYVDQLSGEWSELKDLAKKFALSMGFEPAKVRMPLVGIHRYVCVSSMQPVMSIAKPL